MYDWVWKYIKINSVVYEDSNGMPNPITAHYKSNNL